MAKLSGVKAVNETIEYNGDVYERTEKKAQVGDIIRLGDEGSDYLTDGGYYEVVAVDWGGDAQIFDDDGDGFDTYDLDEGFTVFRKKEEPAVQYREVKRHAKEGERIRIVNKCYDGDPYENGAEFTVTRSYNDGHVRVDSSKTFVLYNEYVVLEPVNERPDRLKVGDYAKIVVFPTPHNSRIPKGEIVRINKDDWSGVPFRMESVVTGEQRWARESDIVRATDEEVAAAKDPRNKFAVGDKVRLISGGGEYPLRGYDSGEIYTVNDLRPTCSTNRIEITGGEVPDGYAYPDQLEKVSAEEVAEYERKKKWAVIGRKPNEYKAGDLVRVTSGFAGIKAGDIAEVVMPDGSRSPYVSARGEEWFCTVELVCPVEKRFDK